MSKSILVGAAVAAALSAGGAQAAGRSATPWVISPIDGACKADLELTGRSGGTVPVVLTSDGAAITLRFAKEELPEQAFLPIRVDQKPYSNIMRRAPDGSGELTLSDATQAALRKGGTLSIAWLSEEPVSAALGGSENGVPDLKTCGAQVAGEAHARAAAEAEARARAESDARARAIAEAQVEAARAQHAVAEAEARRHDAEADAALEQQRLARIQAQREQAYQDAQRQRAAYEAQRDQGYPAYQQPYQAPPQYYPPQPAPQPSYYWPPTPRYAYRRY